MRREADLSAAKIQDLGDQSKGEYLLYYGMPGGTVAALWIDELVPSAGFIAGLKQGVPVTTFSDRLPWTIIHKDVMEVYTLTEYQDAERVNLVDRIRMKKDYERVAKIAESQELELPKDNWNMGDIHER